MTEHYDLSTTDFEEAWHMYFGRSEPDGMDAQYRHVFMAGGAMAIGVLSNRLANLPGAVEPGQMVQALIQTISESLAELEIKSGLLNKGSS